MILHSDRLLIRRVEMKDAPSLFEYKKLNDVTAFQGKSYHSVQDVNKLIESNPEEINIENSWYQLVLIDKKNQNLIGDLGLHFVGPINMQVELGITISPQFQRKGYSREAIAVILNHIFHKLEKHRVFVSIDPDNIASIRLFESLNFRKEAHFKKSYNQNGQWKDDLIYAMLKTEYRK